MTTAVNHVVHINYQQLYVCIEILFASKGPKMSREADTVLVKVGSNIRKGTEIIIISLFGDSI